MIFKKMNRNGFLQLFSIVLAMHTMKDGLIVNASSASHKGMRTYMNNKQIYPVLFSLYLYLFYTGVCMLDNRFWIVQYMRNSSTQNNCYTMKIENGKKYSKEQKKKITDMKKKMKTERNQQQTILSTTGYMYLTRSALQITSFQYFIP